MNCAQQKPSLYDDGRFLFLSTVMFTWILDKLWLSPRSECACVVIVVVAVLAAVVGVVVVVEGAGGERISGRLLLKRMSFVQNSHEHNHM